MSSLACFFLGHAERPPGDQIPRFFGPQPSDRVILIHLIKFATFIPAFASINAKVANLTAIAAKNGLIMKQKKNTNLVEQLIRDIVAKNLRYCCKTDLAGAKKKVLL
jgi:hypothetical protein